MNQATCEPRIHAPERKLRRSRTTIGVIGVVGLAGTGAAMLATSLLVVPGNNMQGDKLIAAAADLAHNRNTCRIKATQITTTELGKPAVQVTIDLTTKTRPNSLDDRYDKFGVDVAFRDRLKDDAGTPVTGIAVVNETAAKATFISGGETGPDTGASTITIPQEVISNGKANYAISLQNAVEVTRSGPLVSDGARIEMARIPCGQFAFQSEPPSLVG